MEQRRRVERDDRTDGCGAGQGGKSEICLGESDGGVDHRLLIAGLIVGERVAVFMKSLAQTRRISMAENPEHRWYQPTSLAIALAVLDLQILDQCL